MVTEFGFSDKIGVEDLGFIPDSDNKQYQVALDVEDFHLNGSGIVHGGIITTLLDCCMARVYFLNFSPEQAKKLKFAVTVEMKVNFFKAEKKGRLTGIGTRIREGRRTAYTEGEIYNKNGDLVAKGSATLMVEFNN
jgi:uncharacterized protein (TIGR00369 family)